MEDSIALRKAPFTFNFWLGWIGLVVFMLLLQLSQLQTSLSYSQSGLASGEIWRLVSAHFVHLSWPHVWLNVAGLSLCGLLNPKIFRLKLLAQLVFLSFGISILLWQFNHEVSQYVGFSGVLYGLFLLALWPLREDLFSLLMLVGIFFWALWQWKFGVPIEEQRLIGGQVISIAHLYGLGMAATWLVIESAFNRYRKNGGLPTSAD